MALASDLASLFWARALGGVMAGSISASFAYAADITTEENRAKGMGMIGAAFGLGFIAGPAIGGLLAGGDPTATNFQLPSFAAAGFSFVSLILAFIILKESLSVEMRARIASRSSRQRWDMFVQTVTRADVRLTLILTFVAIFAFAGLEATFAMWTEREFGWGVRENGYIFAFIGAFTALIQGVVVGPMAKRIGEMAMIRQGFAALGIGLVMLPFANNLTLLLIALTITGYGFAVSTPALNSLLSLQVDAELRGSVLGIGRSFSTLARVLGPASAGYIFVLLGRDWPFFAGAALMALVLMVSYLYRSKADDAGVN
jgi:DHA1 family tetracycline resistance protein-like MFS transporter